MHKHTRRQFFATALAAPILATKVHAGALPSHLADEWMRIVGGRLRTSPSSPHEWPYPVQMALRAGAIHEPHTPFTPTERAYVERIFRESQRTAQAGGQLDYNSVPRDYDPGSGIWDDAAKIACDFIGGGAQLAGYSNIYLDALGAVCFSWSVVDTLWKWGENYYAGYMMYAQTIEMERLLVSTLQIGGPFGIFWYGAL
jgi:hypothetical protein